MTNPAGTAEGAAQVNGRPDARPAAPMAVVCAEAAARFDLPADGIGDLLVVADLLSVLGTRAEPQDLGGLDLRCRRGRNFEALALAPDHVRSVGRMQ